MFRGLRYTVKETFVSLFRGKVMTIASIFSITAMLLILGLFFLLTVNVNMATEGVKNQFDNIEVFLLDETTEEDAAIIQRSLSSMDEVPGVAFISKDQAMQEFKTRFGSNAHLLDGLTTNPLPNSLRVTIKDISSGEFVAEICRNFAGVEDVRFYQTEVSKILDITNVIQKGALIIIAFLIIVSIVVVSNTIRLTVMARADEIKIMKNVGATNWFIRGPLLLQGLFIGCLSALIALGITWFAYQQFTEEYGYQVAALLTMQMVDPWFMLINLAWVFVALGTGIGAVGSIISIRKFLKA